MKSTNSECFNQMILKGQDALIRVITDYVVHYHDERSQQVIGNVLANAVEPQSERVIQVRERPGG